jgi:hypothetical protein
VYLQQRCLRNEKVPERDGLSDNVAKSRKLGVLQRCRQRGNLGLAHQSWAFARSLFDTLCTALVLVISTGNHTTR